MMRFVKRTIAEILRKLGYEAVAVDEAGRPRAFPQDFDEPMKELWKFVSPFTMTSKERVFALRQSVEYLVQNEIGGAIVECGVWKGGSMMAIARTLHELKVIDRALYLFDTFEGMSEPTAEDVDRASVPAREHLKTMAERYRAEVEGVRKNLLMTGYPEEKIFLVKGKVEETIPGAAPDRIALLRLDTDWYESTHHELRHLYPRLVTGGVLIIDDYGHWAGARKAVDTYFAERGLRPLLQRIDYTGRICVKTAEARR